MTMTPSGDLVRQQDPDRFLLSLLAPRARRPGVWALCAFHHEIARTREVVTDTRLGLIRLQWWRDALNAVYAGKALDAHPVLSDLAAAIVAYDLPQERLDAMIYAREFDLEDRLPANQEGVIFYADYTATPLLDLMCRAGGEKAPAEAVRAIAVGYALTGILRATSSHLSQRRCYLPADRLPRIAAHYEGRDLEDLRPVAADMAAAARAYLARAGQVGGMLRGHACLARMYLRQVEKAGFDLFSPRLGLPPFLKELRVLWRG